jgi:hypothetical protein
MRMEKAIMVVTPAKMATGRVMKQRRGTKRVRIGLKEAMVTADMIIYRRVVLLFRDRGWGDGVNCEVPVDSFQLIVKRYTHQRRVKTLIIR